MRLPQRLLLVLLAAQLAATAQAGVTAIKAVQVPQDFVPNVVVNDLFINFTGVLRGQQLAIDLDQGSIYQSSGPNDVPIPFPIPGPVFPKPPAQGCQSAFDTCVAIGSHEDFHVVGGAVDLEPGAPLKFDTEGISIAWAPGTGVDLPNDGGNDLFIARIILTNNAMGTLKYLGTTGAGTGDPLYAIGGIRNGVINFAVPEPAAATLFALGLVTCLGMRRARR
jgi:hypothetical protein